MGLSVTGQIGGRTVAFAAVGALVTVAVDVTDLTLDGRARGGHILIDGRRRATADLIRTSIVLRGAFRGRRRRGRRRRGQDAHIGRIATQIQRFVHGRQGVG